MSTPESLTEDVRQLAECYRLGRDPASLAALKFYLLDHHVEILQALKDRDWMLLEIKRWSGLAADLAKDLHALESKLAPSPLAARRSKG